jgi:hypothetical protein
VAICTCLGVLEVCHTVESPSPFRAVVCSLQWGLVSVSQKYSPRWAFCSWFLCSVLGSKHGPNGATGSLNLRAPGPSVIWSLYLWWVVVPQKGMGWNNFECSCSWMKQAVPYPCMDKKGYGVFPSSPLV